MDFDLIYKEHYQRIFSFCYRMTGDEESARDKTQETFIKLFELMKKGYEPGQPGAWLYKVSGNLCLNHAKRAGNYRKVVHKMGLARIEHENPETGYIKKESIETIRNIINELDPGQRMLILLYQDGLSYKELSQATGIAVNSVGKTLWRTINLISKKIKENG